VIVENTELPPLFPWLLFAGAAPPAPTVIVYAVDGVAVNAASAAAPPPEFSPTTLAL
jgi:hypothetical protein